MHPFCFEKEKEKVFITAGDVIGIREKRENKVPGYNIDVK